MSGHNKWSTIKHKKAKEDAKRGKVFTKLIKEITVAAREGGGDPEGNVRLRNAITAARSANMPNDNIDKAIKKGTGDLDGVSYEEISYEGYGPGGVAIFVKTLTDNKNRTVAEVRSYFNKHNGNLAANGSVSYLFHTKGQIIISKEEATEEKLMDLVLEAGAEDLIDDGEVWTVYTDLESFNDVVEAIKAAKIEVMEAEIAEIPDNTVSVTGGDAKNTIIILDKLENCDDVQKVYSNADISEEDWEEYGS